jgi:di/tripeptidase
LGVSRICVVEPRSNAHGPNEFLHIRTGKKVTAVVAKHFEASKQGLTGKK